MIHRLLCYAGVHRFEAEWIGRPCSNDRPHYCTKARSVCRDCGEVQRAE